MFASDCLEGQHYLFLTFVCFISFTCLAAFSTISSACCKEMEQMYSMMLNCWVPTHHRVLFVCCIFIDFFFIISSLLFSPCLLRVPIVYGTVFIKLSPFIYTIVWLFSYSVHGYNQLHELVFSLNPVYKSSINAIDCEMLNLILQVFLRISPLCLE